MSLFENINRTGGWSHPVEWLASFGPATKEPPLPSAQADPRGAWEAVRFDGTSVPGTGLAR